MWMVSYVVDIALSVTHLGKVIRGHFYLVLGILNFAFKYGPDRIEQKQLRDISIPKKYCQQFYIIIFVPVGRLIYQCLQ